MRRVVFGPKSKKIYFIMNLNIDSDTLCNSLEVLLFSIAFHCFSLLGFVSFFFGERRMKST